MCESSSYIALYVMYFVSVLNNMSHNEITCQVLKEISCHCVSILLYFKHEKALIVFDRQRILSIITFIAVSTSHLHHSGGSQGSGEMDSQPQPLSLQEGPGG